MQIQNSVKFDSISFLKQTVSFLLEIINVKLLLILLYNGWFTSLLQLTKIKWFEPLTLRIDTSITKYYILVENTAYKLNVSW